MEHFDPVPPDRFLAPLCRRYLLVLFKTLRARMTDERGELADLAVLWALGVLADGQYESAGAWAAPRLWEPAWPNVFYDLQSRGVEHIRFVVSVNAGAFGSALEGRYPNASGVVLGSEVSNFSGLPANQWRAFSASQNAMRRLQCQASRSIGRHGAFSSSIHASSFVTEVLASALKRLSTVDASREIGSTRAFATGRRVRRPGAQSAPLQSQLLAT